MFNYIHTYILICIYSYISHCIYIYNYIYIYISKPLSNHYWGLP